MLTQYIIHTLDIHDLRLQLRHALDSGVRWVEICASPSVSDTDIADTVESFRAEFAEKECVLILADRYELVPRVKADGVHIYRRDIPLSQVRSSLDAWPILGVSIETADDLHALRGHDIDYIFFSPTFPADAPDGLASLAQAARLIEQLDMEAPLVAGGGITAENAHLAVKAGANALAIDHTLNDIKKFITQLS